MYDPIVIKIVINMNSDNGSYSYFLTVNGSYSASKEENFVV